MAVETLKKSPRNVSGTDWTDAFGVIHDGGVFAFVATNTGKILKPEQYDFSSLPTTITIKGIEITLDAWKDETSGSMTAGKVSVELSWNNGTSWTSIKNAAITTTEQTFNIGGSTDTWGRTWTRAELQSGTFMVRLTSAAGSVLNDPQWRVDWSAVTIHFEDTTELTHTSIETLKITPLHADSSIVHVNVNESLKVTDSGSDPTRVNEGNVTPSGTTISDNLSTPLTAFQAAGQSFARSEAFGALISLSSTGPILLLGDDVIVKSLVSASTSSQLAFGLVDIGDINRSGNFGESSGGSDLKIKISASSLSDIFSSIDTMAGHSFQKAILGQGVTAWAFIDGGDGYQQRVIFNGVVESATYTEDSMTITAIDIGKSTLLVPDIFVNNESFDYEATDPDTGRMIEETQGKPVPIGIGRFDHSAIQSVTEHSVSHPLRFGELAGHNGHSALWPSMFGVRHPVMPTILAARKWRRPKGLIGDLFNSWPFQTIALFGSKKGTPNFSVGTRPAGVSASNFIMPGHGTGTPTTNPDQTWFRKMIFSMISTEDGSSALACFLQDLITPRHGATLGTGIQFQHGAGDIVDIMGSIPFADGNANDAYAVFVNSFRPNGPQSDSTPDWVGLMQSSVVPYVGLVKKRDEGIIDSTAAFDFRTSAGVINPLGAIDLKDFSEITTIPAGERVAYSLPARSIGLGELKDVRICFLVESPPGSSSTATLRMTTTLGPLRATPSLSNNAFSTMVHYESWHRGDGTDYNPFRSFDFVMSNNQVFGSYHVFPFWSFFLTDEHHKYGRNAAGFAQGMNSPWEWLTQHDNSLSWSWQSLFWVEGTGSVKLVAAWMEISYSSPLEASIATLPNIRSSTPVSFDRTVNEAPAISRSGWARAPESDFTMTPVFTTNVDPAQVEDNPKTPVFVTGRGAHDDSSGQFTGGNQDTVIENPADIAGALLHHYAGATVFSNRAQTGNFGSFATARSDLAAITQSLVIQDSIDLNKALALVAADSRSMIQEQIDDAGNRQYRMFVDIADPAANDPSRMYRSDGYKFAFDRIRKRSFTAALTHLGTIGNNISLRYGFWLPSSSYSYTRFCSKDITNLATDAAAYKSACNASVQSYNIEVALGFEAPNIWNPDAADDLLKYLVDSFVDRRVVVEFETYANALDLQIGHVIKLDDSISDIIKYPGINAPSTWSSHQFNVIKTSIVKDPGSPYSVRVVAIETFKATV